jgi:ribosomal protein S18 acetylase RimI-like enzyme
VDERGAGIAGEDLAQLRAGCFRVALLRRDTELVAQQWVGMARQYPPVLETALRLGPQTAYLFGLFVAAGDRRRGWGRQVIEFAEHEARASGATAGFVWIERKNRASVRLLTSVGYRPVVGGTRITWRSHVRFWCSGLDPGARPYVAAPSRSMSD